MTDVPTDGRKDRQTWGGARDACASKNEDMTKRNEREVEENLCRNISDLRPWIFLNDTQNIKCGLGRDEGAIAARGEEAGKREKQEKGEEANLFNMQAG